MLLSPDEAVQFFKLHCSVMCFVNERLKVVPGIGTPDEFSALPPEDRLEVHEAFHEHPELIESFIDENPCKLSDEELETVRSWRHQVAGKFLIFRSLKKHTIFLGIDDPPVAYGVTALTDPIEELVGPYLPRMVETVLLPFRDKIVYDGILSSFNISFGGGIKRSLNDTYKETKDRLGIVTSLPVSAQPVPNTKPKRKKKRTSPKRSDDVKEILEAIIGMTDQFCRQHLNDEYASLCRQLAEKLARKRPSPLLRGKPTTWACGIVRTIGWVNYLDDPTTKPHLKLTAIDKEFGVAESTGQGKSKTIRTMFKIRSFEPDWTLPSRMDDNPRMWLLEVNGFSMDVRHAPREVQEIAFEKGLIPYIPADL
jgi:hypothetical protein